MLMTFHAPSLQASSAALLHLQAHCHQAICRPKIAIMPDDESLPLNIPTTSYPLSLRVSVVGHTGSQLVMQVAQIHVLTISTTPWSLLRQELHMLAGVKPINVLEPALVHVS